MSRLLSIATKEENGSITLSAEQIELFMSRKHITARSDTVSTKTRKPRKPSGYNLFMKESQSSIIQTAEKWKKLTNDERDAFNTRAGEITPIVRKTVVKKRGGPRGSSAYHIFMKDNREKFREEYPDETSGKGAIQRFCAKKWAELKDDHDPIVSKYEKMSSESRAEVMTESEPTKEETVAEPEVEKEVEPETETEAESEPEKEAEPEPEKEAEPEPEKEEEEEEEEEEEDDEANGGACGGALNGCLACAEFDENIKTMEEECADEEEEEL